MSSKDVCLEAVRQNGFALQYVPEARNRTVCLETVRQNGFALQYVPKAMKTPVVCLEIPHHRAENAEDSVERPMQLEAAHRNVGPKNVGFG